MTPRFLLAACLLAATAIAADLPKIPAEPIAKKKELLFSDDFEKGELGKAWGQVVPIFTWADGSMKGTQMRWDTAAQDGKPAIIGHQAVVGTDVPTKDSVIEFRFRFDGATGVSAEFDDRKFTGSHYGHICMARVTPKSAVLVDQKEGSMRNDIYEMKDPSKKAEKAKLLEGRSLTYPLEIKGGDWHTFVLETVNDEMRLSIDGKAVGYLKSPGIAHATKSKVEFGCQGKDAYFDDVKIWNAEPAAGGSKK